MKNVLITGSSRGIGLAIAKKFAKEGYRVILNSGHDKTALLNAANQCNELSGNAISYFGSVTDPDFVQYMITDIEQKFGAIDCLINNAGISYIGLLTDMSIQQWDDILSTNINSLFYCCRKVIPAMVRRQCGCIINISSVWGEVGASCEVAYSASKGAVNAFTKALAKELAPSSIQVNAISCGVIDTQMNACFSAEEKDALKEEIPSGRFGSCEEVGELAYSIANASSYLTGQIIRLDGGWI